MGKYAGVVVLYQPKNNVWNNIQSYLKEIDLLYVMDNSFEVNTILKEKIKASEKCQYVSMHGNQGLAVALNEGCRMAKEDGYDYILTMDQDSVFEEDAVAIMIEKIEKSRKHYAIIAPNVTSIYPDENGEMKTSYTLLQKGTEKEEHWVMTSGSLMNLEDFAQAGGFDESFFIAHIDVDLGIRMQQCNMKILMLGDAVIYQRFGNSKPKKLLWKTVHPWYEDSSRTYYLFRNQTYMLCKYGKSYKSVIHVSLVNHIIKILLFEDKKIEKIVKAIEGYRDGKKGKMGRYEG